MNEIEINYDSLTSPVFAFSRYKAFRPAVQTNRSMYDDVEVFLIKGDNTETIYVYCYFSFGKMIKLRWMYSKGMDEETAGHVFNAFKKSYLSKKFTIELKQKMAA